ncbi:MAG: sulfotransferase domain-containing protein [Actinobacteria bacterium]|nr:sulfotransferase domain-containing protein [Actinomycetota bacterium]
MVPALRRYQSPDEDSARWEGFPFREGDIVISTRSKHGTTWLQMICALLVFQSSEFPAPLAVLSPWLDWLAEPRDDVLARLEAQRHRRFIKTHTPLDGFPIDRRALLIVGARHPLDAAVSLYYQGENLDRDLLGRLTGRPSRTRADRPPLDEWLAQWIAGDAPFDDDLDSLPGVMWHLADAWERRQEDNVVLVHYADLSTDLDGTMRRLAGRLGIATEFPQWDELVQAARFDSMKARANELAPDHLGVLKDRGSFFRAGVSGSGRAAVTADHYREYLARAAKLAPADLLDWLHR